MNSITICFILENVLSETKNLLHYMQAHGKALLKIPSMLDVDEKIKNAKRDRSNCKCEVDLKPMFSMLWLRTPNDVIFHCNRYSLSVSNQAKFLLFRG